MNTSTSTILDSPSTYRRFLSWCNTRGSSPQYYDKLFLNTTCAVGVTVNWSGYVITCLTFPYWWAETRRQQMWSSSFRVINNAVVNVLLKEVLSVSDYFCRAGSLKEIRGTKITKIWKAFRDFSTWLGMCMKWEFCCSLVFDRNSK